MPLVFLAPLLAIALSAPSPRLREATLASLDPASRAIQETNTAALPPTPELAVLQTQTFGTITLDHRAHLARKTSCKACHNPGPVGKLGRLSPKVAHDRCLSCHRAEDRGPTACRDCHVKAAPPTDPEIIEASVPGAFPAGAAADVNAGVSGSPLGAAPVLTASLEAQLNAMRARDIEERVRNPFQRVLGIGFSVMGGAGRDVTTGPAIYMSTREGRVLLLYALEHGTSPSGGRTLGLIGAGVTQPVLGRWNAQALLLGGFDATESPTNFSPNLGVRTGIEWLGRRTSMSVAGTVATNLTSGIDKFGQQTRGLTYSVSANIGYVISKE
jgi:hypothetical protein